MWDTIKVKDEPLGPQIDWDLRFELATDSQHLLSFNVQRPLFPGSHQGPPLP
jgi:hypothetical protein